MSNGTNNDLDIIKINIDNFKECYKLINKEEISSSLIKKKNEIYSNYNCFHINYDSYHNTDKKNFNKKYKENYVYNKPNNAHRLYIISGNFTEEEKIKKIFISYLNKLTIQNKASLYTKIEELLQTNYKDLLYNIIWDFIKKSSNSHLYIELLKSYDKNKLNEHLIKFVENKEWYPTNYLDTSNLLSSDEKIYDKYCEYVKYKKEITNIINAWCVYIDNNSKYIDIILNNFYELFITYNKNKDKKHLTDYALEQIFNIMKKYKNTGIIDKLKLLKLELFESSTKFLILNILEIK